MSFRRDLGTGIALDVNLDFEVGNDGDINSSKGTEELEKDLAIQGILAAQQYLGEPPSRSTDESIKNNIATRFNADIRVESVKKEEIVVDWDRDRRGMEIEIPVTIDGELENVVVEV